MTSSVEVTINSLTECMNQYANNLTIVVTPPNKLGKNSRTSPFLKIPEDSGNYETGYVEYF